MQIGYLTSQLDVASLALYAFWIFFAGLIYYLRQEDKREGYPLVSEVVGERPVGYPPLPNPKTFVLLDGRTVQAPRSDEPEPTFEAAPVFGFIGSPLEPLGNPMLSGTGPAAYALRSDKPEPLHEDGTNRMMPLRVATDHSLDEESPPVIGWPVIGADMVTAGTVQDLWVDRADCMVRYYEVKLESGAVVLVPVQVITLNEGQGYLRVLCANASQFADAPKLASPDQITMLEEDKVSAYFGSGHLYADPERSEPIL